MISERDWIIVGDEAYTPEEWEREQRQRKRPRNRIGYMREYREKNRERLNAYKREWKRNKDAERPSALERDIAAGIVYDVVGSLHSLKCTGPNRATGCRCKGRVKVIRKVEL